MEFVATTAKWSPSGIDVTVVEIDGRERPRQFRFLHFPPENGRLEQIWENVARHVQSQKTLTLFDLDFLTPIETPNNIDPNTILSET